MEDPAEILDILADETFDAHRQVLIEAPADARLTTSGGGSASVRITIDDPEEVVVEVDASEAGFLVLNDAYYPGWKAYREGTLAPIYRANLIFRAVEVPAGHSRVSFVYEPDSFNAGLVISGCSALGLLIVGAWVASTPLRRDRGA